MEQLSPIKEEQLINQLIELKLTDPQWASFARSIEEYPQNIYSNHHNNVEKANILVSRANQKGLCKVIVERIHTDAISIDNIVHLQTELDVTIATQFGQLFEGLLNELQKYEENNEILPLITEKDSSEDHLDFVEKITDKAKFKESTIRLGIEYKNENSVLQRKASKLGYSKYKDIERRVAQLYINVLHEYPVNNFPPEKRLDELRSKLYVFLSKEYKSQYGIADSLYGIIFGTTASCLIFNE